MRRIFDKARAVAHDVVGAVGAVYLIADIAARETWRGFTEEVRAGLSTDDDLRDEHKRAREALHQIDLLVGLAESRGGRVALGAIKRLIAEGLRPTPVTFRAREEKVVH